MISSKYSQGVKPVRTISNKDSQRVKPVRTISNKDTEMVGSQGVRVVVRDKVKFFLNKTFWRYLARFEDSYDYMG